MARRQAPRSRDGARWGWLGGYHSLFYDGPRLPAQRQRAPSPAPLDYPGHPEFSGLVTAKPPGPPGWEKVYTPRDPPNSAVGFVNIGPNTGSAWLISPRHAVTSAHLFDPDATQGVKNPSPANVTFGRADKFGENQGDNPKIDACEINIPQEYSALPDPERKDWDFAVITLAQPVPTDFWFGMWAAPDGVILEEGGIFVYSRGFPSCAVKGCSPDPCDGGMYGSNISCTKADVDESAEETSRSFIVRCPAVSRMSGGPLYVRLNGRAYVIGLHKTASGAEAIPETPYCEAWPVFFTPESLESILALRADC